MIVEYAPAEDHENVQGMVFSNEEFEKLQNNEPATDIDGGVHHLDKRIIGQYNCRHMAMPFLIGISERSFTPEQLQDINARNEKGIVFDGKQMSIYEGTQAQRALETDMRKTREEFNMLKELRDTDPRLERDYQRCKQKLAELRGEYQALANVLKPVSIRAKLERTYVPSMSTGAGLAQKGNIEQTRHARTYYDTIANRKSKSDISKIADSSGFSQEQISDIRNHLFIKKHDLGNGILEQLTPDYRIAQAWHRLEQGKGNELDILLLNHELYELTLIRDQGYTFDEAHIMASRKYPWAKRMEEIGK